jgi:hypothetical protein
MLINSRQLVQEHINNGSTPKYGVTGGAVLICPANAERRSVWVANDGATTVWIGASSNMTGGATGINFTKLSSGSNVVAEHYRGPIYAAREWLGMSSGASLAACWITVADIG